MHRVRTMIQSLPVGLLAFGMLAGGALAVWILGGFNITGSVTTTSGTPEMMELTRDVVYTNDSIQYYSVVYQNDDGNGLLSFSCDMDLVSTDIGCTAEDWTDIQIEIKNGAGWDSCDPTNPPISKQIVSGENVVEYRIVQAANRCPLGAGSSYGLIATASY